MLLTIESGRNRLVRGLDLATVDRTGQVVRHRTYGAVREYLSEPPNARRGRWAGEVRRTDYRSRVPPSRGPAHEPASTRSGSHSCHLRRRAAKRRLPIRGDEAPQLDDTGANPSRCGPNQADPGSAGRNARRHGVAAPTRRPHPSGARSRAKVGRSLEASVCGGGLNTGVHATPREEE